MHRPGQLMVAPVVTWPLNAEPPKHQTEQEVGVWRPRQLPSQSPGKSVPLAHEFAAVVAAASVVVDGLV